MRALNSKVPKSYKVDGEGRIIGWVHIASNDAGTLGRCSAGFILRTARRDSRGVEQWPCNERLLSECQAAEWLLAEVLKLAFPGRELRSLVPAIRKRTTRKGR